MQEQNEQELMANIRAALEEALEREIRIEPGTRFREELGVQSIDTIDFLFLLEKKVGIQIDPERFFQFLSQRPSGPLRDIIVSDVIGFLRDARGAR